MNVRQLILPLASELIVDLFAGGGGASTGIELATGRHVDIGINHDPEAVSLHQANHPQTRHFVSDVFEMEPRTVTDGRPVGLLWASPDCTYHSKARGGKPFRDRNRARRRRGLAWVVCRWAREVRPRVIALENVEEFRHWGPLLDDGTPCPKRRGKTFERWVAQLRNLGYAVEWRELRACDYGAPTIRKRLFLVARCDGAPIVWPEPTHGPGRRPYRTAAECIDWSLPCPSIFERDRPLAEATMRRIAHGIRRYVLDNPRPFIVPVTRAGDVRAHDTREPLRTITTAQRGEFALCSPTLVQTGYGERPGQAPRVPGLDKPLGTAVDGQKHALVAAFLAKHYGGHETPGAPLDRACSTITTQDHHHLVAANLIRQNFGEKPSDGADEPLRTVTTQGNKHALVTSHLAKLRGTSNSAGTDEPLATVSAGGQHHAEVRALLLKWYGQGGPGSGSARSAAHDPDARSVRPRHGRRRALRNRRHRHAHAAAARAVPSPGLPGVLRDRSRRRRPRAEQGGASAHVRQQRLPAGRRGDRPRELRRRRAAEGSLSAAAIVVAGFGRCGSSLAMQMLRAGGVPCVGEWPAFEDARSLRKISPEFAAQRISVWNLTHDR